MSRFIDRLNKLHKPEPQPFGFGVARDSSSKARLPLAVILPSRNLEKNLENLGGVEAVFVRVAGVDDIKAIEKACQNKDNPPAGGLVPSGEKIVLETIPAGSCDFVAVPTGFLLSLSEEEALGKVLELDFGLEDSLLRSVNDLPVDAVLFDGKFGDGLKLADLMAVRRAALLVSKPILVVVPLTLRQSELQHLWNLGVSGIIVEISDSASLKKLAELRKHLEKLSLPSLHKKDKVSPILPRLAPEAPPPPEGDEEEDE
jgi:hypothetical protein